MRTKTVCLLAAALAVGACDDDAPTSHPDAAPATDATTGGAADSTAGIRDTGVADGGFRAPHDSGRHADAVVGMDAPAPKDAMVDGGVMGGRDAMSMGGADSNLPPIPDTGTGGPGPMTECSGYCMSMRAFCFAQNLVYDDDFDCEIACQSARTLAGGMPGDTTGNTIDCRQTWAPMAQTAPDTACRSASLAGGGQCGSLCEVYCDFTEQLCFPQIFGTRGECMTACANFPTDGASNAFTGDTVQCRINNTVIRPNTACTNAQPDQAAVNGACQ